MASNGWSKTWTFFEGDWHEGKSPIMGPRTHAALARLLGVRRRARLRGRDARPRPALRARQRSRRRLSLKPLVPQRHWMGLTREGIKRFDKETPLYIRPMYWAESGAR